MLHLQPFEVRDLLLQRDTVLLDVREPEEYAAEHIEGAVLHPLSSFDPDRLPPGRVVFQCGTGKRSAAALQRSLAAGLPHDAHLAGGIAAWKQAGLPVISR